MRVVMKRLRLVSRGFCSKVALHLSYLHIKLNDEIKTEFLQISSKISDQPASKVELAFRLLYTVRVYLHNVHHMIRIGPTQMAIKAKTTLYGTPMIYSCGLYTHRTKEV